MERRLLGVALALVCALAATPASARHHQENSKTNVTQFCGDRFCSTFARASVSYERHHRHITHRRLSRRVNVTSATPEPTFGQRTIAGYADAPAPVLDISHAGYLGLETIKVAGGHLITVSADFAAPVSGLIADLYARGYRFTNIKCFATPGHGHHVNRSNHWTGDACDFFGQHPPGDVVRAHGLRSGRDFADSMHVDNARNVGGVAFWNSVRHRHASGPHRKRARYARR